MANRFQCPRCNTSYDGDVIMSVQAACGVCGSLLVVPPPKTADSATHPESPSASTTNPPLGPKLEHSTKTRRKKSFPFVQLIVLGVITALAFGSFRFIQRTNKSDQQTTAKVQKVEKPAEPSPPLRTDVEPQKPLTSDPAEPVADPPKVQSDAAPQTPTDSDNHAAESTIANAATESAPPQTPVAMQQSNFHTLVAPFMQSYCVQCHGVQRQESGLRLDDIAAEPDSRESIEVWTEVLHRMNVHEMPPKSAPQPNPETYSEVIDFLDKTVRLAERKLAAGEGKVVMRRLNRSEYTNTVLELTGVRYDAEEDFPEDEVAHGFDNIGQELILSPSLLEKYVRAAQKITRQLISRPRAAAFQRVMGKTDYKKAGAKQARRVLQVFASRAFRRPVADTKLDRLAAMFDERFQSGESFLGSIRVPLQAVLCSPQFIYMIESPGNLDGYSIATRLSYFLWSSMPDDELLRLAHTGELKQTSILRQQVSRMLDDPRSAAFTKNFAGQWLGLREIGIMQPDKAVFPQYNDSLEASMRQESEAFFTEVLQKNLSIVNFIDSDFAMLNAPLAQLYKIPNVSGPRIRRVALKRNQNRGGILTQASVLSITGDGVDSSPVMRGVWILERMLGTPPSPPPPNVPDFEPDTRGTKTIREELSRHRTIESCNTCHHKIDPLGFALENYDAIGQYRENYASKTTSNQKKNKKKTKQVTLAVDASGDWPNGESFAGIIEFKQHMLQRKEQFAFCLTEKLMTYACGRVMGVSDKKEIQSVVETAAQGDYRFKDLIHQITRTQAFQSK